MATANKHDEKRVREIIKRISDAAIELAFIRHDLSTDEYDPTDYPNREAEAAGWEDMKNDIKQDVLNCLTGDDSGCNDPSELDAESCELIWLQEYLRGPFHAERTLRKM